ncbi:MAG: type II toxin-antitoxin system VapC family toxin [Armatimonadetes bacterium]|nr:type II toxin-antitoxin system VapC family toxin [Armatimonadota bacterium]
MILYAETSAVLAWLLREAAAGDVLTILRQGRLVASSELTRVELGRTLTRLVADGRLSLSEAAARRSFFEQRAARWSWIQLSPGILERAQAAFPQEPVRALDALHLASALEIASPAARMLSLDVRIRSNADALGISALP